MAARLTPPKGVGESDLARILFSDSDLYQRPDATKSADWDESKHPRAADGKWTDGAEDGSDFADVPVREMARLLREESGFTMSRVGDVPTKGYIVAFEGHSGVYSADLLNDEPALTKVIHDWLKKEAEALDGRLIGGWYDRDNHKLVFDPVEHLWSRDEAIALGKSRNQVAIWDLEASVEIPTGGTGGYAEEGSAGKAAKAHQGHDRRRAHGVRQGTRSRHHWPVRPEVVKDFDPNQPRDESGKWTATGASAGSRSEQREAERGKPDPSKNEDDPVSIADELARGGEPSVAPENVAAVLAEIAKREGHPDLTDLRVDGTFMYGKNGLGYARNEMPQIPSDRREEFFDRLREDDIVVKYEKVDPQSLDPVQKEISAKIIAEFLPKIRETGLGETAIIVSKDDYVIDGHHRWATAVSLSFEQEGVLLPIYRIGLRHDELLKAAWDWNDEVGIQPLEMGERSTRDKVASIYDGADMAHIWEWH